VERVTASQITAASVASQTYACLSKNSPQTRKAAWASRQKTAFFDPHCRPWEFCAQDDPPLRFRRYAAGRREPSARPELFGRAPMFHVKHRRLARLTPSNSRRFLARRGPGLLAGWLYGLGGRLVCRVLHRLDRRFDFRLALFKFEPDFSVAAAHQISGELAARTR